MIWRNDRTNNLINKFLSTWTNTTQHKKRQHNTTQEKRREEKTSEEHRIGEEEGEETTQKQREGEREEEAKGKQDPSVSGPSNRLYVL
jgi:hypothetical protein